MYARPNLMACRHHGLPEHVHPELHVYVCGSSRRANKKKKIIITLLLCTHMRVSHRLHMRVCRLHVFFSVVRFFRGADDVFPLSLSSDPVLAALHRSCLSGAPLLRRPPGILCNTPYCAVFYPAQVSPTHLAAHESGSPRLQVTRPGLSGCHGGGRRRSRGINLGAGQGQRG